jgi:hypothetical protein
MLLALMLLGVLVFGSIWGYANVLGTALYLLFMAAVALLYVLPVLIAFWVIYLFMRATDQPVGPQREYDSPAVSARKTLVNRPQSRTPLKSPR